MTMKNRVQKLMTKMNVLPFFDLVVREGYYDLKGTLMRHREIFEKTGKHFCLVHDGSMPIPNGLKNSASRYGCVGIHEEKDMKDVFKKMNDLYSNRPHLKDSLMEPKRSLMGKPSVGKHSLDDARVVLTGTLKHWSRDELGKVVKKAGGRMTRGVGWDTDYLVMGDSYGKTKFCDAKRLGTTILNEREFIQLVAH